MVNMMNKSQVKGSTVVGTVAAVVLQLYRLLGEAAR